MGGVAGSLGDALADARLSLAANLVVLSSLGSDALSLAERTAALVLSSAADALGVIGRLRLARANARLGVALLPDTRLADAVLDALLCDAGLSGALLESLLRDALLRVALLSDALLRVTLLPGALLCVALLPDALLSNALLRDTLLVLVPNAGGNASTSGSAADTGTRCSVVVVVALLTNASGAGAVGRGNTSRRVNVGVVESARGCLREMVSAVVDANLLAASAARADACDAGPRLRVRASDTLSLRDVGGAAVTVVAVVAGSVAGAGTNASASSASADTGGRMLLLVQRVDLLQARLVVVVRLVLELGGALLRGLRLLHSALVLERGLLLLTPLRVGLRLGLARLGLRLVQSLGVLLLFVLDLARRLLDLELLVRKLFLVLAGPLEVLLGLLCGLLVGLLLCDVSAEASRGGDASHKRTHPSSAPSQPSSQVTC